MSVMQLLPYILAVEGVISVVVGVFLLWHFRIRQIYRVEFYRRVASNSFGSKKLVKVGQKDFKPTQKDVEYKKHSYPILFDKMVSTDGRKHIWAFELEENIGLTFGGSHDIGNPSLVADILYSGVLKRFASMVHALDTSTIMLIVAFVVIAVLAFVAGLFGSPYILPSSAGVAPT